MARRTGGAAWIVVAAGCLFMTCLLLWVGLTIVIRCERAPAAASSGVTTGATGVRPDRVDVMVDYRVLGLLRVRRATVTDVEQADFAETGGRGALGSVLLLRPRDGRGWESPTVTYAIGTPPREAAPRINAFLAASSPALLVLWWAPWPPNLLVLPLILVTLLFAVAGVRGLLGVGRARRIDRAPAS